MRFHPFQPSSGGSSPKIQVGDDSPLHTALSHSSSLTDSTSQSAASVPSAADSPSGVGAMATGPQLETDHSSSYMQRHLQEAMQEGTSSLRLFLRPVNFLVNVFGKFNPYAASGWCSHYKMMQQTWKYDWNPGTLVLIWDTHQELSNEYQHDRVCLVFNNICVLVLLMLEP